MEKKLHISRSMSNIDSELNLLNDFIVDFPYKASRRCESETCKKHCVRSFGEKVNAADLN